MSIEKKPGPKPAASPNGRRRDVDLVMRDDIALGLAQPRKLPRPAPTQQ